LEFLHNRKENMELQMQQMLEYRKEKANMFANLNKQNQDKTKDKMKDDESRIIKNRKELEGNEQISIPSVSSRKNINSTSSSSSSITWTFPMTEEDKHKFLVFEDLWEKGFYLTNGSKFGGDFLAYSGDPLQYHAHYVIIVKFSTDELTPLDVISYSRLGVTVKKTPVLASVFSTNTKDKPMMVSYFSIDWQGVT